MCLHLRLGRVGIGMNPVAGHSVAPIGSQNESGFVTQFLAASMPVSFGPSGSVESGRAGNVATNGVTSGNAQPDRVNNADGDLDVLGHSTNGIQIKHQETGDVGVIGRASKAPGGWNFMIPWTSVLQPHCHYRM